MLFLSTPSARRATGCPLRFWPVTDISIHALREEGDGSGPDRRCLHRQSFLSTPSARRATVYVVPRRNHFGISIHALREEGDLIMSTGLILDRSFLSTPSARRATDHQYSCWRIPERFLSTPSARRATYGVSREQYNNNISIHALREEGDDGQSQQRSSRTLFLSTPSARRATH